MLNSWKILWTNFLSAIGSTGKQKAKHLFEMIKFENGKYNVLFVFCVIL